jgi:DNA repair exonuclease SbcCD ATPase subunit
MSTIVVTMCMRCAQLQAEVDRMSRLIDDRDRLRAQNDQLHDGWATFERRVAALQADNERLKAEAERNAIAGAQLFHDLQADNERLRARERELVDAGGNLHFAHPIFGPPHLVAASKRWCELVESPNGGELQKFETELAELREAAEKLTTKIKHEGGHGYDVHELAEALEAVLAKVKP